MKQLQSNCLGCSILLIVLGVMGLISTFFDLGSSNRAVIQLFFLLANVFGSVPKFSLITIGVGVLMILVIFLFNEMRKPETIDKR